MNKMLKRPKVSIIIPVYNAEKYISKCLDSILNQTEKDFEIIIIDDGSQDRSLERCKYYGKNDKRVKVLHQENSGVSKARNTGIKHSNGDYITFVDIDDYVDKEYIERFLNVQKKYNAELVCSGHVIEKKFNRIKKVMYENEIIKKENIILSFLSFFDRISTAPWAKLYKADIIKRFNIYFPEDVPYAEDAIFNIQYYSYINSVIITNDVLYFYNYKDSESAVKKYYPDLYKYLYQVFTKKQEFFVNKNCEKIYKQELYDQQKYYFEWCIEYYIEHCKNYNEIADKLKCTKELFEIPDQDEKWEYCDFIRNEEWDKIICLWKKDNKKKYLKYLIKNKIHM